MKRGFTLIEMLVVVGIIAILMGIGLGSFSSSTKSAQKARGQEYVSNVATALETIYQREGSWPRRLQSEGASDGKLDENVAYELAKRKVMTLTYDKDSKKTTGLDRCGIVTPWAQDTIKAVGIGANTGTKVSSGGTIGNDHYIHFAIDGNDDGIVNASVGGTAVNIRGSVAVWCGGMDGVIVPYKGGGGKVDDIYSWTIDQVVK